MRKILLLLLITILLTGCNGPVEDNPDIIADSNDGFYVDSTNIIDRTVVSQVIFIGKIIEYVDVYDYNPLDTHSGYLRFSLFILFPLYKDG